MSQKFNHLTATHLLLQTYSLVWLTNYWSNYIKPTEYFYHDDSSYMLSHTYNWFLSMSHICRSKNTVITVS